MAFLRYTVARAELAGRRFVDEPAAALEYDGAPGAFPVSV
jgi:hypothetical protein